MQGSSGPQTQALRRVARQAREVDGHGHWAWCLVGEDGVEGWMVAQLLETVAFTSPFRIPTAPSLEVMTKRTLIGCIRPPEAHRHACIVFRVGAPSWDLNFFSEGA